MNFKRFGALSGTSLSRAIVALCIICVQCSPAPVPKGQAHPAVVGWQNTTSMGKVPFVPVTYPHQGEVWLGATHHNVTWDVASNPPDKLKSYTNTAIFLAQDGQVVSPTPLASNFSLLDERVTVQTPKEVSGDGFQVILFVEHGNQDDRGSYSPDYKIVNVPGSPI